MSGAIPDPNYGDNQLYDFGFVLLLRFLVSDEFIAPAAAADKHAWLNFDGINWKADVYLNGEKLGRIEGGFMRGRFDVTGKLLRRREECAGRAHREERARRAACKREDTAEPGHERRRAGRGQSHVSRLDRLGLDSDDSRAQHRHLGQTCI